MAKTSTNSIQSLNEDWSNDTNVNLPFSGEAVQTFIKSYLRNVTAAAWFDPVSYTMYFFANDTDRDSFINDTSQTTLPTFSCPMNFSSTLYRVNITNNTGSTVINTATNAGSLTLSTTFMVQTKAITDYAWSDTQTGCYVTILIDRGLTGTYTAITERALYAAGSTISLDVFSFLINGTNRIKFQFEAEDDSVTQALVYTVNLAELYVELFENNWYLPILENDSASHRLGGFRIAGAGSKTLHLSLFDAAGTKVVDDLTALIGTTNAYANTPFYYQIASGNPILNLSSGVYKVRAHVSTAALESEPIEYNIMFVATEDTATAKLVCINNIAEKIANYSADTVCTYAIYDGTASYSDLTITFQHKQGETVITTDSSPLEDVATRTEHPLTYEVLWPGIEGTGYFIGFTIAVGSVSNGADIPLDNSTVFPPTTGYEFYMLAANRNNGQSNKEKIVNIVDDTEYTAAWTGIDFINGVDGWTTDENGRACLRIPAKTRFVLPYTAFNLLSGDASTVELCYKIANVADYDENIITISPNPTAPGFKGIRIRPNNITVHSSTDIDASNDTQRGVNLCDDEVVHFVLTINPNYEGNHKLVKAYINGCKNFLFSYGNSTDWNGFNGDLVIGSDYSDVFLYFIRHYSVALSDAGVQTNYINSLHTVPERTEMDQKFASVLDSGGTNIDFEAVRDNGYNYFIVNMTEGPDHVPSAEGPNPWGNKTAGKSTLEMHFGSHPHWDFRVEDVETMGQGTTSMTYYRWNIRWRIDKSNDAKKCPVTYVVARTKVGGKFQYTWGPTVESKTVAFDGTNHPELMRITAKINMASSMQSHKMGATRAYTELHDRIGLRNEAQQMADDNHTPRPVVAVYEYPAFGFEYHNNQGEETYTFVGLFTIGPDKGDKPTFGFDKVKNSLISMEGTDHDQPLARFAYPWNGDVNYFYNQEALCVDLGGGTYLKGLEVGNCHGYDTDKVGGQDPIRDILAGQTNEFKDAYELVWKNSTLIFPITEDHPYYSGSGVSATLSYINSHLTGDTYAVNFRKGMYDTRLAYTDMQFWVHGDSTYTLYYFDEVEGIYKPDVSLFSQNGTPSGSTDIEKNEWFKEQRRARFMASAADYFDLDDCIYHFVFCLIFGATDNFAKNSYPYKMATLANGGRWKWRQDDLDTIFDIDNSGRDSKPYQIEYEDSRNNTPYFAGSNSIFWNLINECYWDDYNNGAGHGIRTIGKNVINAMVQLSSASNPYEGFVKYISQCFWGNAQEYFPASAYNVDCQFKYEQAWLVNGQGVPPLSQALGNHYSGERLWVKRRAIYMLSLFHYGPFGDYTDKNLGQILFRPQSLTVNLTPLIWMYPALLVGQSGVVTGDRTQPGVVEELSSVSPSGNTAFYINASNWYSSLGNFKSVVLGEQDKNDITVEGAKLITFLIGAESGEVGTNIPGLVFTNNKCLETIDARRAESITSVAGIANCPRLRTLLLTGTSVPSIDLAVGSKIETLALPAATQKLVLRGLKHLTSLSVAGYSNIQTVHIEDTDVDAFGILASIYAASEVLTYIRILWLGTYVDTTRAAVNMLPTLAQPQFKGLAADGATVLDKPFIEGTIDVSSADISSSNIQDLQLDIEHQEDYDGDIKKVLSRLFNTSLYLLYDSSKIYITFADPEVERLCIANWSADGVGVLTTEAAANNIGTVFQNNTLIVTFAELHYFGNSLPANAFRGCTALVEISLSDRMNGQIGQNALANCTALRILRLGAGSPTYGAGIPVGNGIQYITSVYAKDLNQFIQFSRSVNNMTYNHLGASSDGIRLYVGENEEEVTSISIPGSPTEIYRYTFSNLRRVTSFIIPSSVTIIREGAFKNCRGITSIVIPSSVTTIAGSGTANSGAFEYCTNLASITLNAGLVTIGENAFHGCTALQSISFPSTVTSLGGSAFQDCTGIIGVVTTPSSVTAIGNNAFRGCTRITELILNGITSFGGGGQIATGCTSLRRLVLPAYTSGGTYFINTGGSSMEELDLGPNTTSIASWFFGTDVRQLDRFICRATTPPTAGQNTIFYKKPKAIYVPYSADHSVLNAYKAANYWSTCASIIYELNPDGTIPS